LAQLAIKKSKMKTPMIRYIFCLIFLGVLGCKSNDNKIKSIIASPHCYWDIRDSLAASLGRSAYCYSFSKDGYCEYFFYDRKGRRDRYDFDDNVPTTKTWKLQGDTLIYILGVERKLLSFSNDTILLENPITKVKDTLVKNCK
jgi:hypothetical protein